MSPVVAQIDFNRPQEKGIDLARRKRKQVVMISAHRCKTCVELASPVLVDQDFHFQN
jgi:phosphate starvation-inducible protein PhoH